VVSPSLVYELFGNDVDFTSITAYTDWDVTEKSDFDFSPLDWVRRTTTEDQHYWYQELRVASAEGSELQIAEGAELSWLAGITGFTADSDRYVANDFRPDFPLGAAVVADSGTVEFEVVSRPSGAFVSVDGKSVGRTPLKVEYEVGQKISFFSKARGYLARRHKITVSAEQSTVNLWLAPLPYVVQVVTSPAGANASAVGGGETSTPGSLQFKSMPASRKIVVSKDGYKTALGAVSRADFTEETRRMFATVNVTLQKDPAATVAPTPAEVEAAPEPASIEPPAAEVKAEAEEPAKAVEPPPEAAPAPSETPAAAAP